MDIKEIVNREQMRMDVPDFSAGDTVRVYVRIREGEKERLQSFEGVVLRRRGEGMGASFTVRKVSYGVGVERIFPLASPFIDKIEINKYGKVRRARIYYFRKLTGKKARIPERKFTANIAKHS